MSYRSVGFSLVFAVALLRCSSFTSAGDAAPVSNDAATEATGPASDALVPPPSDGATALPEGCDPTCPGTHGPCGVRVGPSCVDATEVTIGDWRAFALAHTTTAASKECAAYTPELLGVRRDEDKPMSSVSFCEARAYCAWAGKQLCGTIGGGALNANEPVTQDWLWYNACTNGSASPLVVLGDAGCNLATSDTVARRGTCQGGRAGLYDMVGNVHEWVEATEPNAASFRAAFLGSSYLGPDGGNCQSLTKLGVNERAVDIGFRCCAPPP